MAQQPTLSAVEPDGAVLGRQYRARALRRRPRSADDAVLRAVDRRVFDAAAVRLAASDARLAGAARAAAAPGVAVGDGICHQQRGVLLGAAIHPGAERAADPVVGTAIRGGVVAAAVRRAADMGAARGHHDLACGRTHHHPARRPRRARQHPVQQGRCDVRRRALGIRTIFGADAAPAEDASVVADCLHYRLRRAAAVAFLDLGILDRLHAEIRPVDGGDADLCRDLPLHAGISVFQPRHRADRAEPRGAVLSSGAGVRLGDGDPAARRTAAAVSPRRLSAGAGGCRNRVAAGIGRGMNLRLQRCIGFRSGAGQASLPSNNRSGKRRWERQHRMISLSTRRLRAAAVFALIFTGLASAASAQTPYPNRTITLVLPFAAGSGTDTTTRIISQHLGMALGVGIVIDNRPGANGMIAATYVARAAPDGYTLFVTTNTTHSANPYLLKTLTYDPVKDFTPIARTGDLPFMLVIHPDIPANSVAELIALAKKDPGKLSYASGSSSASVSGATFARLAGIDLLHVPYKSSPPALTDVIAGRVSMMFIDVPTGLPHVQGKALRRLRSLPNAARPCCPSFPPWTIR